MTVWTVLEIAAWILSAVIAIWLITDIVRVSRKHGEELLTTSVDEDIDESPEPGIGERKGAR